MPINGELLRTERINRGLSQKELAKMAGVSERLYRSAEHDGVCSKRSLLLFVDVLNEWHSRLPEEFNKLLTKDFGESKPQTTSFSGCLPPKLPVQYIERLRLFESLRALLLEDSNQTIAITGKQTLRIQGMGGIGKTVLAIALANDDQVKNRFSDGIVWLHAGIAASAKDLRYRLAECIGKEGVQELSRLRGEFAEKSVLIVIDDVWDSRIPNELDVVGPKSRIVITSRDTSIGAGASHFSIETLTEDEALDLLSLWSGQRSLKNRVLAKQIINECGNSPLAICPCGALLSDGIELDEVLEALREADLSFLETNATDVSVFQSLAASVHFLSDNEASRYYELAVFPEDHSVPVSVLCHYWQKTADLRKREAKKLIALFATRSLLYYDQESQEVSFHDLHHDFLRFATNRRQVKLHEALLNSISPKDGEFTSEIIEDYYYRQRVQHMASAGQRRPIRELLKDVSWLERKLRSSSLASMIADFRFGEKDALLSDIRRAIEVCGDIVANCPAQLKSQICSRIAKKSKRAKQFLDDQRALCETPWMHTEGPTLKMSGGPFVRRVKPKLVTECLTHAAISSGGRSLITSHSTPDEMTVTTVWDTETGQKHFEVAEKGNLRSQSQISTDDMRFVYVLKQGSISKLVARSLLSGEVVDTLDGDFLLAAVGSDATRYVLRERDGVTLWDAKTASRVTLVETQKSFPSVNVLHDSFNRVAIYTGYDCGRKLFNLLTGEEEPDFKGAGTERLTPDARASLYVKAGNWPRHELIFEDLTSGRTSWLHKVKRPIRIIHISSCGKRCTAYDNKDLLQWNLENKRLIFTLPVGQADDVVVSRDGKYGVSIHKDEFCLWNLEKAKGASSPTPGLAVTVSPNKQLLVKVTSPAFIVPAIIDVYELTTLKRARRIKINCSYDLVAFNSDGNSLFCVRSNKFQARKIASGAHLFTREKVKKSGFRYADDHSCQFSDLQVSADGTKLFEMDYLGCRVFEIESGKELANYKVSNATAIKLDPENQFFLAAWGGGVGVFDLYTKDGRLQSELDKPRRQRFRGLAAKTLALHADRRRCCIAGSGRDPTITELDIRTKKKVREYIGHSSSVDALEYCADGCCLISSSGNTLWQWDVSTGALNQQFSLDESITFLAALESGRFVCEAGPLHLLRIFAGQHQ